MKVAKKKKRKNDDKYITIDQSKIMAYKLAKQMEKTIITKICESVYVALIDTLYAPPYNWNVEKVMRFKKRFDLEVVKCWEAANDRYNIDPRDYLEQRGFDYDKIIYMDTDSMKPYFGAEKIDQWFNVISGRGNSNVDNESA